MTAQSTTEQTASTAHNVDVKTPAQVAALIKMVNEKHTLNIQPDEMKIMMAIVANESNFGKNDGKSSGNAVGLYQFTPSTWNNTVANVIQKHPEAKSIMDLGRENDYAQVLAMTELMRENAAALRAGNGKRSIPNPTYADIYTAHHWGSSRALHPDNVAIADVVKDKEIKANPAHANDTFGSFKAKYNKQADKNHERIMDAIAHADPQMYANLDPSLFSSGQKGIGERQTDQKDKDAWFSKTDISDVLKEIMRDFFKSESTPEQTPQVAPPTPTEEKSSLLGGLFKSALTAVAGLGGIALFAKATTHGHDSTSPKIADGISGQTLPTTVTDLASLAPRQGGLEVAAAAPSGAPATVIASTGTKASSPTI